MRIPKESARYHFFLYKHSHEGDYLESTGEQILTRHHEQSTHPVISIQLFNHVPLTGTLGPLLSLSFFLLFAVFIYSMPGYKCSIRERMLYSSCKNPLVDMVENILKIDIEKKVRSDLL